ncbi:MAG: hypothetical protein M1828_005225 [Chrysothrix sp. TS-e1954]|nr:MAG: hypothetical protein M1828_005225 [Chrysothrix sp. TS-e1954]
MIRDRGGLLRASSILHLDVWALVADCLSTQDLINASRVSSELRSICTPRIWREVRFINDGPCKDLDCPYAEKGKAFTDYKTFTQYALDRPGLAAYVRTFSWTSPHVSDVAVRQMSWSASIRNGRLQYRLFNQLQNVESLDLSYTCKNWQIIPPAGVSAKIFPNAKNIRLSGPLPPTLAILIVGHKSKVPLKSLTLDGIGHLEDILSSDLVSRRKKDLHSLSIRFQGQQHGAVRGQGGKLITADRGYRNIAAFFVATRPHQLHFEHIDPRADAETKSSSPLCPMDAWFGETIMPSLAGGWPGLTSVKIIGVSHEVTQELEGLRAAGVMVERDLRRMRSL